jgi:hypothetical protein
MGTSEPHQGGLSVVSLFGLRRRVTGGGLTLPQHPGDTFRLAFVNISSPRFDSNYHSLQAQWQWKAANSNLLILNYTWSHALTDAPNQFATPQNMYDIHAECGAAEFDRRHAVNGVHVDPADPGVANFGSGPFFDARPDQLADANHNATHTISAWFDTSLFTDPPADALRPGNASRGSVLGPGAWRWDASLLKNTDVGEKLNVQFRVEATNVLNHANFDGVGAFVFDTPHFGQVTSARDPRIIQLGLKMNL